MASSGGSNNWIACDGTSAIPSLDADALIGLLCRKPIVDCVVGEHGTDLPTYRPIVSECTAVSRNDLSGDVDFDLFWFGLLALWQMNREHAILELGFNFACVGLIRKTEAAHKASVSAFHSMVFLFLLFLLELAFARDSKNAILDRNLYIFFFYIR